MSSLKPVKRAVSLSPANAAAGLLYRLQGWLEPPEKSLPDDVLEKITPKEQHFKQLSFTFAVIALSAHIACIDGPLTRARYVAFRDAFPLSGGICGKLRKLFALACENRAPFEHYVTQVRHMFPHRSPLFVSLVDRLFSIATADGGLSREAERMLAKIAHTLDLTAPEYTALRDRHMHAPRPHLVLGVSKRPARKMLKDHYHRLMRRYHPDRFAAEPLSPEIEMLLKLKTSEINEAYRRLRKRAA